MVCAGLGVHVEVLTDPGQFCHSLQYLFRHVLGVGGDKAYAFKPLYPTNGPQEGGKICALFWDTNNIPSPLMAAKKPPPPWGGGGGGGVSPPPPTPSHQGRGS